MKLSILIPAYNEERTIRQILGKVRKVKIGVEKEIIVVDDGSTDSTQCILQKEKGVKVLIHEKNKGKGSALRTGLLHATGDIVVIQDADLEYDPNDYCNLLNPILQGKAEVVYGSRFMRDHKAKYKFFYLGNVFLSALTSAIYGARISDMETCYKMFKKDVLKNIIIRARGFEFEPEITSKILKKGHKIFEVPIRYNGRSFEEGKKIGLKDGVKAIWLILKYRFTD